MWNIVTQALYNIYVHNILIHNVNTIYVNVIPIVINGITCLIKKTAMLGTACTPKGWPLPTLHPRPLGWRMPSSLPVYQEAGAFICVPARGWCITRHLRLALSARVRLHKSRPTQHNTKSPIWFSDYI